MLTVAAGAVIIAAAVAVTIAAARATQPGARPAAIGHVHALAADGDTILVATHDGLFLATRGGGLERVGERRHDLMAFTVTDEGRFYASGHPELSDRELVAPGKPLLLGLVESTDRGQTWQPQSLLGEADFHALASSDQTLYGADATSGRLLVSDDSRTWEARSRLPDHVQSLAVDPRNPDVMVAAAPSGLIRSTDGGRSWQTGGPSNATAVSWDSRTGQLWAAGQDGTLWSSADGDEWTRRGSAPGGAPQALLAHRGTLWAATDADLNVSHDGGTTWN